jgi:hypothetical protein
VAVDRAQRAQRGLRGRGHALSLASGRICDDARMANIQDYIKDPGIFLSLPVEERAHVLMQYIVAYLSSNRSVHRNNTVNPSTLRQQFPGFPLERLQTSMTEAWIWLEREILIAPKPEQDRRSGVAA